MERISKNFNDIDPETRRPFSFGHPDGVWIIAIFYGITSLLVVGASVLNILKPNLDDRVLLGSILFIFVSFYLCVITFFLFKRAKHAFTLSCVLCLIIFVVLSLTFANNMPFYGWAALVLVQAIICKYILGLVRDQLIR